MLLFRHAFAGSSLLLIALLAQAAEPGELKTLMTERGKQNLSDDLAKPLSGDWRSAKGKWESVNGSLKGSERKEDMHGAVARHPLPYQNIVIQYSFKLDGAKQTTLSINDEKGHCCRVLINPTGFTVQKDSHDHNKNDKTVVLERTTKEIKPGEWHTIVVEIFGKELLARLDGDAIAFGAHEAIDVKKANFGFTVAGESVCSKNLRVWEALPDKNWEATKAKLLAARAKTTEQAK